MAILIKTQTSGWYENPETGKKARKTDGDTIVDNRAAYDKLAMRDGKPEVEYVELSSGARAPKSQVVEITCQRSDCSNKRLIKKQDVHQVKYCVEHQQENRKAIRREKLRTKRALARGADAS